MVLYHGPWLSPLVREDGQMTSVIELATQLTEKWEQLIPNGATLLKKYDHLPEHGGSLLPEISPQRLRLFLQEVTEQHLQQKMQPIQQAWDTAELEELLHHALFAALGAPNWSAPFPRFHHLQRVTPLELLRFWLQQLKTLELLLRLSDQAFHTTDWKPWRKQAVAQPAILPDQLLLGATKYGSAYQGLLQQLPLGLPTL